jgi:hypothetical protein
VLGDESRFTGELKNVVIKATARAQVQGGFVRKVD